MVDMVSTGDWSWPLRFVDLDTSFELAPCRRPSGSSLQMAPAPSTTSAESCGWRSTGRNSTAKSTSSATTGRGRGGPVDDVLAAPGATGHHVRRYDRLSVDRHRLGRIALDWSAGPAPSGRSTSTSTLSLDGLADLRPPRADHSLPGHRALSQRQAGRTATSFDMVQVPDR